MKQIKSDMIKRIGIFIGSMILLVIMHGLWCNQALQVSYINVEPENLPTSFDGFRIAQISDLHNTEFKKDNENLLSKLQEIQPDIIVITGDMIDSRRTNTEVAFNFVTHAVEIAPCYYVTGNHESRIEEYENFENELIQIGVTVLRNQKIELTQQDEKITLIGVDDPAFEKIIADDIIMNTWLEKLKTDSDSFTILLSHRPELFDIYVSHEIDVVFCGHVHGGQIRLPMIGGLFGPNQGLLPQYDAGVYTKDSTNMVVSRGLGNSLFPLRINNQPEIVLVELVK